MWLTKSILKAIVASWSSSGEYPFNVPHLEQETHLNYDAENYPQPPAMPSRLWLCSSDILYQAGLDRIVLLKAFRQPEHLIIDDIYTSLMRLTPLLQTEIASEIQHWTLSLLYLASQMQSQFQFQIHLIHAILKHNKTNNTAIALSTLQLYCQQHHCITQLDTATRSFLTQHQHPLFSPPPSSTRPHPVCTIRTLGYSAELALNKLTASDSTPPLSCTDPKQIVTELLMNEEATSLDRFIGFDDPTACININPAQPQISLDRLNETLRFIPAEGKAYRTDALDPAQPTSPGTNLPAITTDFDKSNIDLPYLQQCIHLLALQQPYWQHHLTQLTIEQLLTLSQAHTGEFIAAITLPVSPAAITKSHPHSRTCTLS